MAYHNGAVWPHDNALIAYGFFRFGQITITNLPVAGATVDLQLTRHEDDVTVRILRRDGAVDILVAK